MPLHEVRAAQYQPEVDCRHCNQRIFDRGTFVECACEFGCFRTYCAGCEQLRDVTFCAGCLCGYCRLCISRDSRHSICYYPRMGGCRGYPCVQCAKMFMFDKNGYDTDLDGHDHGHNRGVDCCDHTCSLCVESTFVRERIVKTVLLTVYSHCFQRLKLPSQLTWRQLLPWRQFGCTICFTYFTSRADLWRHSLRNCETPAQDPDSRFL